MNRRPSGSLFLSKAITGFLQYKAAEGLSPNTLRSYEHDLKLWLEYAGDMPVNRIKTPMLQEYFVWLRTDYQPRRIAGDRQPLCRQDHSQLLHQPLAPSSPGPVANLISPIR